MKALRQISEVAVGLFIFIMMLAVIAWVFQIIVFSGLGIFGLFIVCVVIASCARFVGDGT